MKPRIFVGSSQEAIRICRAVQSELDDDFEVTVWNQDVFKLGYSALDSLLNVLDSSDAGVFVLQPDDLTLLRNVSHPTVRDNVILELGMFIGRLGRDRTFMLTPSDATTKMSSDLLGLTTAHYDSARLQLEPRAAVGPACHKIRERLAKLQLRVSEEHPSRARLDRAMARMSRDLEWLLTGQSISSPSTARATNGPAVAHIGRASVEMTFGRIEDYCSDTTFVVALPSNEYFDDDCLTDIRSSLGAFARVAYGNRIDTFLSQVRKELAGLQVQRVPRAERRTDSSYGIGQAIFVRGISPAVILVSATTERTGIGLRAEPHFLYAALQGIVETMNANRLDSLSLPVLGSGHGGMPLTIALLFNLLALRSILNDDIGRHLRRVRIVVLKRNDQEISEALLHEVMARMVG
jgi:hypothetical protein